MGRMNICKSLKKYEFDEMRGDGTGYDMSWKYVGNGTSARPYII